MFCVLAHFDCAWETFSHCFNGAVFDCPALDESAHTPTELSMEIVDKREDVEFSISTLKPFMKFFGNEVVRQVFWFQETEKRQKNVKHLGPMCTYS